MRYYSYISDSKVDALLGQLPSGGPRDITAELSFNLGLFAGKLGIGGKGNVVRTVKLAKVERAIRRRENVMPIGQPGTWITGSHFARAIVPKDHPGSILFLVQDGNVSCLLGGSAKHLIGELLCQTPSTGYSFVPRILESLRSATRMDEALGLAPDDTADLLAAGVAQGQAAWAHLVERLEQQTTEPTIPVSFLAKRMLSTSHNGRRFVVGSPLYVELLP